MKDPAANPLARFTPWILAAGLAFTAVWLAEKNLALRAENQSLRTERMLAEIAYKVGQNQLAERTLLAENMINELGRKLRHAEDPARLKIFRLTSPAGSPAGASVIAVWNPDQQAGLLSIEKLPAIADSQDYQIWITDPAYPDPVSGGVFHIAADGKGAFAFKPGLPVAQATAFAISLEKNGGVPKAGGPFLLLGR